MMRSRLLPGKRGIFIISVLFLVVLVSMFVGAAFELAPSAFKRVGSQADLTAAQRAARSGVEYALARLKADTTHTWRGGTTRTVVVNTADLVVVEEQGNVIGLVRHNGSTSQFRLRFNWQDGGPARDGLPDAPAAMEVQVPLVCYSNFTPEEKDVPNADGPGYSVPAVPTTHTVVPAYGVFLVCEGRSGDWLNGADSTNPNPALGYGSATTARVETVFKVDFNQAGVTAAAAASAGSFKATLPGGSGSVLLDSANTGVKGRVRSKADMEFVNGAAPYNVLAATGKQGEVLIQGTATGVANATTVNKGAENPLDNLYKITWADVKQAAAGPTNQIQGGVYTVWQDGTLHYYDKTIADYKAFMAVPANQTNPGVSPPILPATVTVTKTFDPPGVLKEAKLTITGDTLINATLATSDLVIMPKKSADTGAPPVYDLAGVGAGVTNTLFWHGSSNHFHPGHFGYTDVVGLLNKVAISNGWSGNYNLGGGLTMESIGGDVKLDMSSNQAVTTGQVKSLFAPYMLTYLNSGVPMTASDNMAISQMGMGGDPAGMGEIPLATADSTTPQNLLVSFEPGGGTSSAVLSGPGNVTLGAQVKGQGGSITAVGNINMVGLGVDLAASTSPNEGVSLYSQKDIFVSTFDKLTNKYHDVGLKGVVYCWGNLSAVLGATTVPPADWGKLQLNGALVAYGKDPTLLTPATAGKVNLTAKQVNLKFDSTYLWSVMGVAGVTPGDFKLGRVWWYQQ